MFRQSSRRHRECLRSHRQYFLPCYLYRIVIRIRLAANKRGKGIFKKETGYPERAVLSVYTESVPSAQLYDLNQTGFCRAGKDWRLCAPLPIFPLRCRAEETSLGRSKAHRFS